MPAAAYRARVEVTVVIVAYGNDQDLERCLASLAAQTEPPEEVIVFDNAPGHHTGSWLADVHPGVRVLNVSANVGFAEGANRGVSAAASPWVLVLNPDTILDTTALERLRRTAAAHPNALVTAKLLRPDGSVEACGLTMHVTGIASCREQGIAAQAVTGIHQVSAISGAALMGPRRLLQALGPFDARYFMYFEDVDLSLRAAIMGVNVLCDADVTVTHARLLRMTPDKFRHLERNRLITLLKLLQARTFVRLLPALVLTELATTAYALLRGPRYVVARVRAWADVFIERQHWLAARAKVQGCRKQGDHRIFRHAATELPFTQLTHQPWLAATLERLSARAFRLAAWSLWSRT